MGAGDNGDELEREISNLSGGEVMGYGRRVTIGSEEEERVEGAEAFHGAVFCLICFAGLKMEKGRKRNLEMGGRYRQVAAECGWKNIT